LLSRENVMITSCVILNYNDSETTINLLEIIFKYSTLNYIIVVDNHSSDDSYRRLLNYKCEKLIIIRTEKNGGYGYGNNVGIRYAYSQLNSDYILVANPDVDFSEALVKSMIDVLIKDPICALVSGKVMNSLCQVQNSAWRIPTPNQYIASTSLIINKLFGFMKYSDSFFKDSIIVQVDVVPGSLLMVNANLMIEKGMYDEDIFLYCEEIVLAFKFKSHGLISKLLLNKTYTHRHSVSINKNISSLKEKRKIFLKSRLIILEKYYRLSRLRLVFVNIFFKISLIEYMIISKFTKKLI